MPTNQIIGFVAVYVVFGRHFIVGGVFRSEEKAYLERGGGGHPHVQEGVYEASIYVAPVKR